MSGKLQQALIKSTIGTQPAERGESIKPGVKRSGTPGSREYLIAAREVGGSEFSLRYRSLRELSYPDRPATWGFAALHPRLYAVAALRGLSQAIIN